MKKYFIFASDERSYLDLKNIVLELKKRKLPYFFLYARTSHRISPVGQFDKFNYDSNIEESNSKVNFQTLGFSLPFNPTHLIITNENWEPEKTILYEFKTKGCFISCVDNSTWLRSGIKGKLEIGSRKNFPSNCIDIFFEHSEKCKKVKELAGMYPHQSVVVGNPRNDDINFKCTVEDIIIVYGSMEQELHSNILNIYYNIKNKNPDWDIYYRPHPNEIKEFPNDFDNVNLLSSYDEYFNILPKSNYNVMLFGSTTYYPLILNKNVVIINNKDSGVDDEENIENYKGHEFNFWSPILKLKTFDDFKNYISTDFLNKTKIINKEFESNIASNLAYYDKDCTFMGKSNSINNKNILKYFDEFNDKKASKRIINYLENN